MGCSGGFLNIGTTITSGSTKIFDVTVALVLNCTVAFTEYLE